MWSKGFGAVLFRNFSDEGRLDVLAVWGAAQTDATCRKDWALRQCELLATCLAARAPRPP